MKKLKILIGKFLCTVLCSALLATSAAAYESIPVRMDGRETSLDAKLVDTTTYVPFREANALLSDGSAVVTGTNASMHAAASRVSVSADLGRLYIEASGRYLGGSETRLIDGELHVPVRSLAKAYGAAVSWEDSTRSVELTSSGSAIAPGASYYRSDEVFWLARIIHAEAQGEPMAGKILVGNVILNRVRSGDFPNTIYSVIFDRKWGVQFTPIINGAIYNNPGADSVIAAKICLDGYTLSPDAMYFLNPRLAQNFWVPMNRPYLMTVGCHDFYS